MASNDGLARVVQDSGFLAFSGNSIAGYGIRSRAVLRKQGATTRSS
jgi:hypothetical protein